MPDAKKRLVIIGNGMAGGRFIEEMLAREGGSQYDITVFGEEPCGNYNRILLSSVLAGRHKVDDIFINPVQWYEDHGIRFHRGVRAGWIDRISKSVYAAGGIVEPYDKLVIATGSSPYVPPMAGMYDEEGGLKPGIFTFRTLEDCRRIMAAASPGSRAVVVGGGLLGLEAASGLLAQGMPVHVVHLGRHLMDAQLDSDAGAVLKNAMEGLGVEVSLDQLTTTILGDDRVTGVAFKDGDSLDCDLVVVAAGVVPNVDLAKQAGLQVRCGIVIKEDLGCRNEADVYAIGECSEFQEQICGLFAPLAQQARILADRLTGFNPDSMYLGAKVSTKLKVMGVEVAVMGDKDPRLHDDEVVHYSEPRRGIYKKLIVRGERLAGGILMGDDVATPDVLQAFDRGELVPENRSELLFPSTGELPTKDIGELPDAAQICNCNAVSKGAIFSAFRDGCRTFEEVSAVTKAGTCCGACKSQVRAVLGWAESPAAAGALAVAVSPN